MMQEKRSEGSPSNLQDVADKVLKKPLMESTHILCSDSNSGINEAAEEIKTEFLPFKKRSSSFTTSENDNLATSQSQLERSESGGKSSLLMSAGEANCGEKNAEDENTVEDCISTMIHEVERDCVTNAPVLEDGKQTHQADPVLNVECSSSFSPVDPTDESWNDAKTEVGHHEKQPQASVEDGSNNRPDGEEQNEGANSRSRMVTEGGNTADDVDDREQVHPADRVTCTKPEGGGGSGSGLPTNTTVGRGSDANYEGDDDGHLQQAALKDPGGEKGNDIAPALGGGSPSGCARQGLTHLKRSRSTLEQAELAQEGDGGDGSSQQFAKKCKHGSDGSGSSYAEGLDGGNGHDDEPPVQQANSNLRLFGLEISCVPKERKLDGGQSSSNNQSPGATAGDGSRSASQPKPVLRLFGVDIYGVEVQPAAIGTKDGGSSSNHAPGNDGGHGGGESSMQPPKSGLRLFGFDISK